MNLKRSLLTAACALLVAGCSSVPTRVDKGPIHAATFSFMSSKAPASVVVNENREEVHQLIQTAIATELEQKGLQPVPNGGDVQVGYMVIVANNATTATYDDYFGYGRDAAELSEKAHKLLGRAKSRDRFEVGAIVIDVIDPTNSKLLFRSYVHTDVQDITPANRAQQINQLVASCLGGLRVGL